MPTSAGRTPCALLTRHFLRQFLENDLVSPEADRSQLLAIAGAAILSLTVFASAVKSSVYLGAFLTPGQAAVLSLNDKFFYLALAMIVAGLVAAAQWDALSVDARDASILTPLPVPVQVIRRAKLSAVALLGGGAALGVSLCPAVIFPSLLVFHFRQMGLGALLALMAAHALMTMATAVFGYVTILSLREALMAALGGRGFERVSPWAQSALIVILGGMLLLLPAASGQVAARGFDGWRALAPPTWWLGVYELAAGGLVADLPRAAMPARLAAADRAATELYARRRTRFPPMAARAASATGATLLIGVLAYAWNGRRMPSIATPPGRGRMRWRRAGSIGGLLVPASPPVRAGFEFARAAMWRSRAHRLTLASAAAVGLAMAVVAFTRTGWPLGSAPGYFAIQPLVYGALLVGFRHVVRVPAELRANWGVQVAWRHRTQAFLSGVRVAALLQLVIPTLIAIAVCDLFLLGMEAAVMHGLLGLAGAIVLLEALLLGFDKVPFTCSYLPQARMKALAPMYLIAFVLGAAAFARLQHAAVHGGGAAAAFSTLAAVWVVLRLIAATQARRPVVFEEAPVTIQRLGLDG